MNFWNRQTSESKQIKDRRGLRGAWEEGINQSKGVQGHFISDGNVLYLACGRGSMGKHVSQKRAEQKHRKRNRFLLCK